MHFPRFRELTVILAAISSTSGELYCSTFQHQSFRLILCPTGDCPKIRLGLAATTATWLSEYLNGSGREGRLSSHILIIPCIGLFSLRAILIVFLTTKKPGFVAMYDYFPLTGWFALP
jgi:hypothetical protein